MRLGCEAIMTKFLLDPRVLDDGVGDSVKDVEIVARAAAYFRQGENSLPEYVFYLNSVNGSADDSFKRLDIFRTDYSKDEGDLSLRFQRANVIFMPITHGAWLPSNKQWHEAYMKACGALFVQETFLKGDAEKFKDYGIQIL